MNNSIDLFITEIDYNDERVKKIREYRQKFEVSYNNFIKNLRSLYYITSFRVISFENRKSRIRDFSISNKSILLKENYNKVSVDYDKEKFMLEELLVLSGENNDLSLEEKILFEKLLENMEK